VVPRGRRFAGARRSSPAVTAVWVGVCLFLTGGLVFASIYGASYFKKKSGGGEEEKKTAGPGSPGSPGSPGGGGSNPGRPAAASVIYPRRLLFIHLSHYMYLNPLTHGSKGGMDRTRPAAEQLAFEWHVPNEKDKDKNQLFCLSDTARQGPVLPLKPVIAGSINLFCDTSRPQDRIILYYGGHAVEKNDKAYLVPAEGDLDDVETLIPVESVYAKLAECKATQKVVIWDVCRFNPERGRSRPGSEPMTEKLAAALSAAPAGVQVVLTCQPGENALEFFTLLPEGAAKRQENVIGSSFLEAVRYVGEKGKLPVKDAAPGDPFPVEEWVKAIDDRLTTVNRVANSHFVGDPLKQSVRLVGAMPAEQVPYNPGDGLAARFDFPQTDRGAPPGEVAAIFDEIQLPPFDAEAGQGDDKGGDVRADAVIPFRAEVLADYKDDGVPLAEIMKDEEKYRLRRNVLEAFQMIRDLWGGAGGAPRIEREFPGTATDALKKDIENKQKEFPARATAKLSLVLTKLEAVEKDRAQQPKRWQAHYDYAVAQVKARLAFVDEYNSRLGNIRTEVLPELDKAKGQDGYRLVSVMEPKSKSAKALGQEANELYDKIIADYKGTPWAIQARRDKSYALGLAWQPYSSGKDDPMKK
jgi:hypothetical protein